MMSIFLFSFIKKCLLGGKNGSHRIFTSLHHLCVTSSSSWSATPSSSRWEGARRLTDSAWRYLLLVAALVIEFKQSGISITALMFTFLFFLLLSLSHHEICAAHRRLCGQPWAHRRPPRPLSSEPQAHLRHRRCRGWSDACTQSVRGRVLRRHEALKPETCREVLAAPRFDPFGGVHRARGGVGRHDERASNQERVCGKGNTFNFVLYRFSLLISSFFLLEYHIIYFSFFLSLFFFPLFKICGSIQRRSA